MRIRLNPNPSDGGGNPAPQPAPDFARPPAAPGEARTAPEPKPEPKPEPAPQASPWQDERKRYEAELAELRQFRASVESEKEQAEKERLRKAGDAEQLMARYEAELKRRDEAVAAERRRYLDSTLERDLAVALAEFPWVDGAAARVAKLFREELETVERNGQYHTIARESLRPIADHLKERIAGDPFFKHLLKSDARPGSGATNPSFPAGSTRGDEPDPDASNPILNARRNLERSGRLTQGGGFRIA